MGVGARTPAPRAERMPRQHAFARIAQQHSLQDVTELDLADEPGLSIAHVQMVAHGCTRLANLTLAGAAHAMDDLTVGALTYLPKLTRLNLDRCEVTDAGLSLLAAGVPLESEEVTGSLAEVGGHGGHGKRSRGMFAALAHGMGYHQRGFEQLVELSLVDCPISDGGVQKLADGCARLEALNLSACRAITDRSMCALARHATLTSLTLSGCELIDDTAICALARSCPLVELRMQGCVPVSDFAIRAIAEYRCKTLLHLDAGGCRITDAALKSLAAGSDDDGPMCLETLDVANCSKLTNAALKAVVGGLPALRTLNVTGCALIFDSAARAAREARPGLQLTGPRSTTYTSDI